MIGTCFCGFLTSVLNMSPDLKHEKMRNKKINPEDISLVFNKRISYIIYGLRWLQ